MAAWHDPPPAYVRRRRRRHYALGVVCAVALIVALELAHTAARAVWH